MNNRNVIVIGASAGGVEALSALVSGLPENLPAAVLVVLHVAPHGVSLLPDILRRRGKLPATHAVDGEPLKTGRIYVAPPDRHLLVENETVRVVAGPSENGHRPAVDPLFRSAAFYNGSRTIGVVLSGMLDDGTAGLLAVKQRGGIAVVQSPEDALFHGMPTNAIDNVAVDHVVAGSEIGPLLARLVQEEVAVAPGTPTPEEDKQIMQKMAVEVRAAAMDPEALDAGERAGKPSPLACPECGGVLWETEDGHLTRYRCRVGHAYSPDSLLSEQIDALNVALWTALRALEESMALSQRLEDRARSRGHNLAAERFARQRADGTARAEIIRQALRRGEKAAAEEAA